MDVISVAILEMLGCVMIVVSIILAIKKGKKDGRP